MLRSLFSKKRLRLWSIPFILWIGLTLWAAPNLPQPTDLKYVNDYTGILTPQEATSILSLGQELETKTGAQAVVVIVPSTDGVPIEEYTLRLFRTWGIGESRKDNGLLLCVALSDRTWRVEVGRGLEGAIPDALSHQVMTEYAKPYFLSENYGAGITNSYSILSDAIAQEYGVSLSHTLNQAPIPSRTPSHNGWWVIMVLVAVDLLLNRGRIFSSLLQILFWSNLSNRRGPRGGGGFGGGNGGFGGGSSNGGGSSGSW
ncbi:MAG: TPM domain-containing protein [Cellulosilyticaceae bacterium]